MGKLKVVNKNHSFANDAIGMVKKRNVQLATENQLRRANKNRLSNPIEEGKADVLPWWLYDRLYTSAGSTTSTEYDFFTTPIGGAKTYVDTNLEQVSRLADPEHFDATALRFYFSSDMVKSDIDTFLNTYWAEFWIGSKAYTRAPLTVFPGGAGLQGFTTQTNIGGYSNGFPSPGAVVDFRMGDNPIGHHILQGQTFKVKVITSTGFATASGGVGLKLLCILDGILSRGVQ